MKNKYIERRLLNLGDRISSLAFKLSFNRNLSKEQQEKLKRIEG